MNGGPSVGPGLSGRRCVLPVGHLRKLTLRPHPMKPRAALLLLACALSAGAADPPVPAPTRPRFQLELLPRSLQKNPLVDVNVITELTSSGRTQAPPTARAPVYFVATAGRQLALGQGAAGLEKSPEPARLQAWFERALAAAHHRPATPEHPATLVITYSWGTHAAPLGTDDAPVDDAGQAAAGEADDLLIREMIERARLVGGDRFATELVAAISAESQARRATPTPRVDPTGSVATQPNVAGSVELGLTDVFSPLERFRHRDDRTRNFMEDIGGSIHFVVASAYDAASVAANRRVLLWRTKLTVRATGLSLADALPPLIATAGPYFGRDMAQAESIRRRLSQAGTVELGPMEVQGYDEPRPAPDPAAPPAPPPPPRPPPRP